MLSGSQQLFAYAKNQLENEEYLNEYVLSMVFIFYQLRKLIEEVYESFVRQVKHAVNVVI